MAQQQSQQQQYTPEQVEAIKKKLASMSPEEIQELVKKQCVFCRILGGEIPTYPIWEDKKVFVTLEINPANEGHILIFPKKHYSVLPQMPDSEVGYLFSVAKHFAGIVFEATKAEGVAIRQRNGQVAGQMIPHVHVHVIPRFSKDGVEQDWKPKKFSEAEFKKIQAKLAGLAKSVKVSEPKPRVIEKPIPAPEPSKLRKGGAKKKSTKRKGPKYKRRTP